MAGLGVRRVDQNVVDVLVEIANPVPKPGLLLKIDGCLLLALLLLLAYLVVHLKMERFRIKKIAINLITYLFPECIIIKMIFLILIFLVIVDIALISRPFGTLCSGVLVASVSRTSRWIRVHHVILSMAAANLLHLTLPNTTVWQRCLLLQMLLL